MKPNAHIAESIRRVSAEISEKFIALMEQETKLRGFDTAQSLTVGQLALAFIVNEASGAALIAGLEQEDFIRDVREILTWPAVRDHRQEVRNVVLNHRRKATLKKVPK